MVTGLKSFQEWFQSYEQLILPESATLTPLPIDDDISVYPQSY